MAFKIRDRSFCALDFVCDDVTGRLSTTKVWLHIANIIMSKVMLAQQNVGWELMAAYGAVVGGSHVATMFLKWKYNVPDTSTSVSKE